MVSLLAGIVAGAAWFGLRPLLKPAPPRVGSPVGPTEAYARELQQEVEAKPGDVGLQLRLGNLHVERRQFDLALAPLEKAAGHPQTAGAASLLLAKGADVPERAATVLPYAQTAVAAAPTDARSWEGLVRVLYTLGKREEAGAALHEALRRFPRVQRFRFMQAEALAQDGSTHESVRVYRAALKAHPDAGAQLMLGLLLARLRQTRDAQQAFTRAIELDPAAVAPYLGLARVNLELGQLDAAEKAAYSALQVAPEDPEAAYLLARVLLARGDAASLRTARELLDRVLAQRPDHMNALYERGVVRLKSGDSRGAVRDLQEVVAVQPERTDARQSYASALRAAGDAKAAAEQQRVAGEIAELEQRRDELTARISQNPKSAAAWCDLGDFYLQHDIYDRALDAFGRARRLEPANARAAAGLRRAQGGRP